MTVHSASDRNADRSAGDKRARILAAAERVFAKRGFFAARVSEIAKDAGVADGTIYLYFKSKDDLLISLFESRMKQVNTVLREAIATVPATQPIEQLRAFIRAYLRLVHDEPAAAEVLTIELRQSSKFMKEYENVAFADFLRMLGGLIAAGQASGDIEDSVPSHVAARMIFGMLDELSLAWVLAKQPIRSSYIPSSTGPSAGRPRDLRTNAASPPGIRPKKFDIVRAADWVVALINHGLVRQRSQPRPSKEMSP